jgi:hypothetical protein
MFSAMLPLNRKTSWITMPTLRRSSSWGQWAMSRPSIRMRPRVTSYSRVSSLMMVVLPAPVAPTKATFSPGATRKETSRSTQSPSL